MMAEEKESYYELDIKEVCEIVSSRHDRDNTHKLIAIVVACKRFAQDKSSKTKSSMNEELAHKLRNNLHLMGVLGKRLSFLQGCGPF